MLSQVRETQADWLGHVIVCGLPGVGLPIVEELTLSGVSAVVIDDDPAPAPARMIAAWGVPLITGQARAEETLISAGLAGAIAVICAQENDLSALETALLVRRLRAGVRVIAQLANPAVGRAVREAGVAVLDVAGLSAPSVVEVCLGEGVQELSLSGMRFLAARTTAPHAATLRELYGALAPVAVVPPTGDVLVCPGRDTPVSAGDEVTLIGTPDELAAVSVIDQLQLLQLRPELAEVAGQRCDIAHFVRTALEIDRFTAIGTPDRLGHALRQLAAQELLRGAHLVRALDRGGTRAHAATGAGNARIHTHQQQRQQHQRGQDLQQGESGGTLHGKVCPLPSADAAELSRKVRKRAE